MNLSGNPEDRKFTEKEKTARIGLKQAVSLHLQGNKAGALKALRQALALDPTLVHEKLTINLTQELTGLPMQEALGLLANEDASKSLIKSAHKENYKTSPAKPPGIEVYALAVLTVVLVGMVIWGVVFGRFDNALASLRLLQLEGQKHNTGGYDYYLIVPDGPAPKGGWPVVVALHGLGGYGRSMTWMADNFTDAGVIFVAPTFGRFEPYPGNGPIQTMSVILTEIATDYSVQPRGAVLLGLSQGGTFAFRFSLFHPEQIYGVVTAGAPEYDQVFPAPSYMPYVFTWGELDGLQDYVIPGHVRPMQAAGYNITTYIIPGSGHEVSPFAIEQALNMTK